MIILLVAVWSVNCDRLNGVFYFKGVSVSRRKGLPRRHASDSVSVVRVYLVGLRSSVAVGSVINPHLQESLSREESVIVERCLRELSLVVAKVVARDCVSDGWSINLNFLQ